MPLRNAQSLTVRPQGVTDAVDGTDAPPGSMQAIGSSIATEPLWFGGLNASQLVYDFGESINRWKAARVAADAVDETFHTTAAQADYNARLQQSIATGTADYDIIEMGAPFEGDMGVKDLLSEMPDWVMKQVDFDDIVNYLKPPVGTGPYVIADVQPGRRLILRRNPDYWARDLPVQRGLFNFDEIEIDYYRDADSSFEAFKAGLCDFRQETDAGRWITSYDFPAVRDGRIVAVGSNQEIQKLKSGQTKIVDLGGHFVMPGFNDAHVHLANGGFEKLNVNLAGTKSLQEMQQRIAQKVVDAGDGFDAGKTAAGNNERQ